MAKKLDAKEVELYLLENKDFFLSRESLVSELSFKHDAQGATSLLEMQVRKLRDEQSRLMDMLSGFVSTGKENEELFFKSKNLTLSVIAAKDFDEVKKTVELFFEQNFEIDSCILEILTDSQLQELENKTNLDMNKDAIHMGPLSKEKMDAFFSSESVKSAVISVMKLKSGFGLLKIGSNEPTKYLGDGDTTFIEYIRDIIVTVLESKEA
ncbi:DUF484 family protein [Gammaproteobacteria bacterium]|jgi:uncharacterized protein YigA (DUF484 family)|nr:DUF484 family protein [Gammaproteobacteria bacterium]MDC1012890.1 DUF484 family protein [Gammaproteobacteria bacterium]